MTIVEVGVSALIGSVPALLGWGLTAYIRERSRDIIKTEFSGLIKGALDAFRLDFMAGLNGPNGYRRSEDCILRMEPLKEKLGQVDTKLSELHDYSHDAKHELQSKVAGIELTLNAIDGNRP